MNTAYTSEETAFTTPLEEEQSHSAWLQLDEAQSRGLRIITSYDGVSISVEGMRLYRMPPADQLAAVEAHLRHLSSSLGRTACLFLSAYGASATLATAIQPDWSHGASDTTDATPVERRIRELLQEAYMEQSEDRRDSLFSVGIRTLVDDYGATAVSVIDRHWRMLARIYPDEFGEILVNLGRCEHEPTRQSRRLLVEKALAHPDAGVRDAATLGLDALGDPASEPALRRALELESVQPVRDMIEAILQDIAPTN